MAATKILSPEDCLIQFHVKDRLVVAGVNTELASNMLLQLFHILHLVDNKDTYVYKDGVYCIHAEELLRRTLYAMFEGFRNDSGKPVITTRIADEIIARTCSMSSTTISNLQSNRTLLNLSNCVMDLENGNVYEHSPDFNLLTQLPVEYNPDAECPRFMEFLDQAIDPQYMDLAGEIIGYTLWPDYNVHKAFMFLGPKRTGKGTMIRVIEALNGSDNCSHVSLQNLVGERFARARLFGKRVNTYGDLPATSIADAGIFKNVTGGDEIDAEYKNKQIFSFRNTAKLIYSANSLPMIKVDDDAFYNRWSITPYVNSVYGKEDPNLTAKLTTPEELSGILNFGLEGLARLKKNFWQFSDYNSGATYRRKSNPALAFLEDCCEPSDTEYVTKAELLQIYNKWASEQGLPPAKSKKAFGGIIQDQTIIPVDTFNPQVGDVQVEAWAGIRIKG